MEPIARLMDEAFENDDYLSALKEQKDKVADPELTPSARMLREMRETELPFFRLEMEYSKRWGEHFRQATLSPEVQKQFDDETRRSIAAQEDIEQGDGITFKQYLADFYAQYTVL
jgi:glutamate--cysteine ligase